MMLCCVSTVTLKKKKGILTIIQVKIMPSLIEDFHRGRKLPGVFLSIKTQLAIKLRLPTTWLYLSALMLEK